MKIVYDNIIFSLQKAGGISVYWSELIKRLLFKNTETSFYESENQNIFRKNLNIKIEQERKFHLRVLRYAPFLQKLPKKSIFHSSYYRVSLQKDIVNITTVHDFTYEYFRTGLGKMVHTWQKSLAIHKSDGIICVSQNTKRDLLKFYPFVNESKIIVIYNGVSDGFTRLENPNEYLVDEFECLKNNKYIVFIGDRSSYKNFNISIEVIKKLKGFSLAVVGGKDFDRFEIANMKDATERVLHFKGLSEEKLNIVYNNAHCLLYPSSYEGFGIPIVEAMKAGCPVVSTNTSSIPEVAGDAALLVDEIKADSFIVEIVKLQDSKFRAEIINKGIEQSKQFSWDVCFEQTNSFYETVWNEKFGE